MYAKVYNSEVREKRLDHYLRLRIDNSEIVKLLRDNNSPPNIIRDCYNTCSNLETYSLEYTDKNGIYWDNSF